MSYVVVKMYSFECDIAECLMTYDYTPRPDRPTMLRSAHQELREAGWTVTRSIVQPECWRHFCPAHKTAAGGGA